MKRFILNTILFSVVLLISFYVILLSADGYSDPFYLKFTTPKQNNLILGTSKAAQGLNPYVINEILDTEMYNYSFSISSSPYGIKYLESIKRKLSYKKVNGIFIISVDSWSISSLGKDPNDIPIFRENNSCVGTLDVVDKNPNFSYLLKFMSGNYYKILHKQSVAKLHENGWLDVSLSLDSTSVYRRTKSTLLGYEKYLSTYNYSQVRFEYLIETIKFLNTYGNVYLVRLPTSVGLMKMENQLIPNFNEKLKPAIEITSGYLDLADKNSDYKYTDGVHLSKNSGKLVSEEISYWIKNIENAQTQNSTNN
jgi:hypothetical protein